MIEQYLSNTNESATVRKILTSHGLNKAIIRRQENGRATSTQPPRYFFFEEQCGVRILASVRRCRRNGGSIKTSTKIRDLL
jgi:hypothetical protein